MDYFFNAKESEGHDKIYQGRIKLLKYGGFGSKYYYVKYV